MKLPTPRLSVVLSVDDEEALPVQTLNVDLMLAEQTGRKHGWGSLADSPITYQTFLAWAALRREHRIPDDLTYDTFAKTAAAITSLDADEGEATNGTPTPPGPGPG